MKTTAGILITIFGGATWILSFLSLLTEHSTSRPMPTFAIGYLIPSSLIVFVGIRLFQAGRRKPTPQPPVPGSQSVSGSAARPSTPLKITHNSGTPEMACFFDINIPEARLHSNGVYEIGHATPYTIVLANQNRELRCDAKVWIDGMQVGTWRIDRASSIRIERPENDTGRFTFYQLGTPEANRAGLDSSNPALGLIRVKFMPETHVKPILASGRASDDGGTGLSGQSEQIFNTAAAIRHDEFAEIIRQVRLVALPGIRPLRPAI
jgi:hypothetical protein